MTFSPAAALHLATIASAHTLSGPELRAILRAACVYARGTEMTVGAIEKAVPLVLSNRAR